ncbi:MAG: response regulator transcription factor [Marinoscillum sp.]
MKLPKLLFLEDEPSLARIVSESLTSADFSVTHVLNGQEGLNLFHNSHFDICVVDVMMPELDGLTFVKELRKTNKKVPIIFLTAKSMTEDVVKGYKEGGNDYLKKPFSLEELILRIKELLKRTYGEPQSELPIGHYLFYPVQQELWLNDQFITKLSYRETQLLHLLAQHKDQVLDRKICLLELWGDDSFFQARTMDVYISKLRKHLSQDQNVEIMNVRGVGYKLITKVMRDNKDYK